MAEISKPLIGFKDQLKSIPIRNEKANLIEEESSEYKKVYAVQLKYGPVMSRLKGLLKLRNDRHFELTGLGLSVYDSLDGKKTVEKLIDELIALHKLTFFEARALLIHYLQVLMQRGLVVMVGLKDNAKGA